MTINLIAQPSPGTAVATVMRYWDKRLLLLSLTCRMWHHRSCIVQPWGYADHESIQKPILLFRILSNWFLNTFTELESTASCDKLFHLLMTRTEKTSYISATMRLNQFSRATTCWGASVNSFWSGTKVMPRDILYSSIKSALFRRSSQSTTLTFSACRCNSAILAMGTI